MRYKNFLALAAVFLAASGGAFAQQASGPVAKIKTSLGTITVALDRAHAPATVDNFIRYAKEGHYDGTMFYRVVPHFVIQAGSIDAKGHARATHDPIPLESGLGNVRGAIAMARGTSPVSATAEFFINLANNKSLDAKPTDPPHIFLLIISPYKTLCKVIPIAL